MSKVTLIKEFLTSISTGGSFESVRKFYHPDAVQIEFPNLLAKEKIERDIKKIEEAADRGKKVMISQNFEVIKSYEVANVVIIEAIWTGILAIDLGTKSTGATVTAHFAQFYEFEGALILRQRNYDCFENFL